MYKNLPVIAESDFQSFVALGVQDFPADYASWTKMIADRRRESAQMGTDPRMIPIASYAYEKFCAAQGERFNLKSLERFVDETAATH
jgi:hypothetical protein